MRPTFFIMRRVSKKWEIFKGNVMPMVSTMGEGGNEKNYKAKEGCFNR